MSAAPRHDGVWERRAAAAVHAAYAEADLRLEALQLDLLEPRPDGTRWTAQQVDDRRTAQALKDIRDTVVQIGSTMDAAFATFADRVGTAVQNISTALFGTTRDDYTLAGPSTGGTP